MPLEGGGLQLEVEGKRHGHGDDGHEDGQPEVGEECFREKRLATQARTE